jgi:hypothetical protein
VSRPPLDGDALRGHFRKRNVVVVGRFKVSREARMIVNRTMVEVFADRPHAILLAANPGVSTAAFIMAAKQKRGGSAGLRDFYLTVVLPSGLGQAPDEFREALKSSNLTVHYSLREPGAIDPRLPCACLLELNMVPSGLSFVAADEVLLGKAGWGDASSVMLAFTDRTNPSSGNPQTIAKARDLGMYVIEIEIGQ